MSYYDDSSYDSSSGEESVYGLLQKGDELLRLFPELQDARVNTHRYFNPYEISPMQPVNRSDYKVRKDTWNEGNAPGKYSPKPRDYEFNREDYNKKQHERNQEYSRASAAAGEDPVNRQRYYQGQISSGKWSPGQALVEVQQERERIMNSLREDAGKDFEKASQADALGGGEKGLLGAFADDPRVRKVRALRGQVEEPIRGMVSDKKSSSKYFTGDQIAAIMPWLIETLRRR